ncbi:PREDICTED: uncharacterized protein LOC107066990 [Polistes dominula]|uniref:Uncharacterized protein LOC107066990 n=1 Tax=Polistes dominula TaxID=743375 RepID=A0ABM1IBJ4_POLDO|nr:PREDICTED: uncharacterized protein LOC107066990 [Polistes dominula]
MALSSTKGEIPENVIVLTQKEAIAYRWKQIYNWKPQKEVWPLSYGAALLGGVAALSSFYINTRIRKIIKLRTFGSIASAIPMTVCPALITTLAQMEMVSEKVVLPMQTCPLCLEMRSILVQNTCGILYPLVLSPVVNLLIAKRVGTFRMPYYTSWKEVIYFSANLFKVTFPSLAMLSVINTIAAIFLVYKQFNCISYMDQILTLDTERDDDEMDTKF